MTKWQYTPEVEVNKQFGRPVNERGWFISSKQPNDKLIKRIKETKDALQKFLEDHNITLGGDYDGNVYADFNDMDWGIEACPTDNNKFDLVSHQGYTAGTFERIEDND